MRNLMLLLTLLAASCEIKREKAPQEVNPWVWDPIPSPNPAYACFRYVHKLGFHDPIGVECFPKVLLEKNSLKPLGE